MEDSYTVRTPDSRGDLQLVATRLSAAEAAKVVFEEGGRWRMRVGCQDYKSAGFRRFEYRRAEATTGNLDARIVSSTVPMTNSYVDDRAAAERMIHAQILGAFSYTHKVVRDDAYHFHVSPVARKRIRLTERRITFDLLKTLIGTGYVLERGPCELTQAKTREELRKAVAGLVATETAEVVASKHGVDAWVNFRFGGSGWDVVTDCSAELKRVVESVVEPYLPWSPRKPQMSPAKGGARR